MTRRKPEARIRLTLNSHLLQGERWGGKWVLICPDWPDIAERYAGVEDATGAIAEFEKRATGVGESTQTNKGT
jgi:hypothetical protein